MKKIKATVIGLAMVIFAAGAAYAQPGEGYNQNRENQKGRIPQELNLKSDQQKKLMENRKAQREAMEKLRSAIRAKEEELQQALSNPGVTQASVTPIVNQLKTLQGQMIDLRTKGILSVKAILTPEQFAKFQQMMQEHQKERKERFTQEREKWGGPKGQAGSKGEAGNQTAPPANQ